MVEPNAWARIVWRVLVRLSLHTLTHLSYRAPVRLILHAIFALSLPCVYGAHFFLRAKSSSRFLSLFRPVDNKKQTTQIKPKP